MLSHKQLNDIFIERNNAKIAILKINIKILNLERMKRKYFTMKGV
jgi:hypothetical protein